MGILKDKTKALRQAQKKQIKLILMKMRLMEKLEGLELEIQANQAVVDHAVELRHQQQVTMDKLSEDHQRRYPEECQHAAHLSDFHSAIKD